MCVKCTNIYHKCCVLKFKKHIRFIEQNKIICCEEDNPSDKEKVEQSVLEKTTGGPQ